MIVEIGHFALILTLVLALVQMVVPFWGAQRGNVAWMQVAVPTSLAQFPKTATAAPKPVSISSHNSIEPS